MSQKISKMPIKSAKSVLIGVARSLGEWTGTQEVQLETKLDSLMQRLQTLEQEMHASRLDKNGPLKWVPPNRNTEIENAIQFQALSASQQSSGPQIQGSVPNQATQPQVMSFKPVGKETKPQVAVKENLADVEESRSELTGFLKNNQKEEDTQREILKKRFDRMLYQNHPKLEKHMMTNPLKLFTPKRKLKFDSVKTKTETVATPTSKSYEKPTLPSGATATGTSAKDSSTPQEPSRKQLTRLAAWAKSLEPQEPLPEQPKKVAPPPTLLQVITSKTSHEKLESKPETSASSTPSEISSSSDTNPLYPSLIERLQASSSGESKYASSPFPVPPYSSLSSPPTEPSPQNKNRRQINKPLMTFGSSLISIENMIDLSKDRSICSINKTSILN